MSIKAIDTIDALPNEMAAAIACDPWFADIPIVVAEKGNVTRTIAERQSAITEKGGKRGVAVIILQIIGEDEYPNVNFGPMALRVAFQIVENVELNNDPAGTGKSARKVARKLRDVIKPLRLMGLTTDFIPDKPNIEPVTLAEELGKNIVAYQVNFVTYENDDEEISQCATPLFADAGTGTPQIAITSETEGAQVWFTTDDSFPTPTSANPNSTAQLYGVPVDIPETGAYFRAIAIKDGMVASQVNRAWIDYDKTITPEL